MSFHTERPVSTEAAIAAIRSRQAQRVANQRALLENFKAEQTETQNQALLESVQAQTEENSKNEATLDSMKKKGAIRRAVKEATVGRLSLLENAKAITMNKVLFEMVYDAYWLDDNVKRTSVQETYNAYKDTMAVIESVCGGAKTSDDNKSKFIKAVEAVVEEVCQKATDRILQEAKETGNPDIQFNFTTEEESELDQKLSELGKDEIVELVRSKVLTVVQDEKRAGKEKAELMKELETADAEEENPEDMKNMKVKLIGKSLESTSVITENTAITDDMDIDVEVEEISNTSLMKYVSDKVADKESVEKCLVESGAETMETESIIQTALNEKSPDAAIIAFKQYQSVLKKCKVNIAIMKMDAYVPEVKSVATLAIDQAIKCCDDYIGQMEKAKNATTQFNASATLESMRLTAQKRALSKSTGSTLFESLMMNNANGVQQAAVTEGVSVTADKVMNAALIESILQYTVMETLNTMQLYNFTASDVNKLKAYNRSQLRRK